jgi:serine/threonine-protein kinase
MKEETLIDGRYRLLEAIGRGGEAEVFRARDERLDLEIAVRLPLDPKAAPVETRSLPAFHPGWVRLYASGRDAAHGAYQVFELLRGETLPQALGQDPPKVGEWLDFVRQSLEAVAALHAAGWVHGDLNAENFLRLQKPAGTWKLLELPFLRLAPAAAHSPLFGSIHTLAPEQLNGRPADARSDTYALGCLYYYAAAGKYPHPGANSREIAISRLRFPPVPLDETAPRWPAPLRKWVMGLLELDPSRRPADLSAARHLLELAVNAESEPRPCPGRAGEST